MIPKCTSLSIISNYQIYKSTSNNYTNTANNKAPPKELLNDIINLSTNEEFKDKLGQIEDKLKQFIDNYKLKFGECFACDIACCTSEVERLKYFRKYYPGPPKDYLQGKKKCKCP